MRRTHQLKPTLVERLEPRIVLSQGIGIAPATIAPLNTSGRARMLNTAAIQQINQAFDSFTQDYLSAQGAYFNGGSSSSQATDGVSTLYFRRLVVQRIDLLAEELTQVFVVLPKSTRRVSGAPQGSIVLQTFLRSRITGENTSSLLRNLVGPANSQNVIPAPGVDDNVATLYTASSLNAIETGRTATINATGYLLRGTFTHGKR